MNENILICIDIDYQYQREFFDLESCVFSEVIGNR